MLKSSLCLLFIFVLLKLNYVEVVCQSCNGAQSCQACYAVPGCAWCASSSVVDINSRCYSTVDSLTEQTCPADDVQNEESYVTLEKLELTDDNQISIRKANVHLRVGDTQSFQFDVRAAEDFPLDVYFVVDISFTLLGELDNIKDIANEIADSLQNISTRFQIGFGSYVDKLAFPFAHSVTFNVIPPGSTKSVPSACVNDVCRESVSYTHDINLTNSSSAFAEQLKKILISTNADNPEGTFDAMAQSILCKDIVGWRENSRKIMVVITDAPIHTAGDGILSGIVEKAPKECKTVYDPKTDSFTYLNNAQYDYPSIEQLRMLLEENLVLPVFAVQSSVQKYYEALVDAWSSLGAQRVTLEDEASNIIDALETAYDNIVSEVRLSYNVGSDRLLITNSVSCPEDAIASSDGLSCSGVDSEQTITFTVNITLLNCTEFVSNSKVVNVNVPGYGRLEIEVDGICSCQCEADGVVASTECSGNGLRACGVCNCYEGWTGDVCNCRTDQVDSLSCETGINGAECSGSGECLCGDCQCRVQGDYVIDTSLSPFRYNLTSPLINGVAVLLEPPRVFGSVCECTNYLCDRSDDGLICSGDQGNCTCSGNCECSTIDYGNLPYTGTACQCNKAFCFNRTIPFTQDAVECNGNGQCNPCDIEQPCNCKPGFVPPYCVPSALTLRQCFGSGSTGRSCVQCYADNVDNYATTCTSCSSSSSVYSLISGAVPDDLEGSQNDTTRECVFTTADPICTYRYYIAIGEQSTTTDQIQLIAVEPNTDCFPLRWWHLALILFGSLIILGLLILVVVKAIIVIMDYKEVKHLKNKAVTERDLSK